MASAIDPTKPVEGNPTTQSVRDNFAAAKSEIEQLQLTAGVGPQGPAGTITGASANTLAPGTNATVTLGGTPQARTFTFGIPQGIEGPQGPIGTPGLGAGGAGLTSGGAVGSKLVKTGAANYAAAWFGENEDIPLVRQILVRDYLAITLVLDRPAPANAYVQFWRRSRRVGTSTGSSNGSGVHRHGTRSRGHTFRPIHDRSGFAGSYEVPIPAGAREILLPRGGGLSYDQHILYRPVRVRGAFEPWRKKLSNPFWQLGTDARMPNKVQYRFSVRVMGAEVRARKSQPSEQTLEFMRFMEKTGLPPKLIARVF